MGGKPDGKHRTGKKAAPKHTKAKAKANAKRKVSDRDLKAAIRKGLVDDLRGIIKLANTSRHR